MDELKILLVGQSPLLADVIEPGLSGFLPNFKFQAVAKPRTPCRRWNRAA